MNWLGADVTVIFRVYPRARGGTFRVRSGTVPHIDRYTIRVSYTAQTTIPAAPARLDWSIFGRPFGSTVFGLRVNAGGNVELVTKSTTRPALVDGAFDTGLSAATYGLQEGGTGTLRYSADWRESVRVTAGTILPADVETLERTVDSRPYALGLLAVTTASERELKVSGTVAADDFVVGAASIVGTGGGPSGGISSVTVREVSDMLVLTDRSAIPVRADHTRFDVEIHVNPGTGDDNVYMLSIPRVALASTGKQWVLDSNNPTLPTDNRDVHLTATLTSATTLSLTGLGPTGQSTTTTIQAAWGHRLEVVTA